MRVPIPEAPEMSARGVAWAVAVAVAVFTTTAALSLVSPWLALVPNCLLLIATVYLVGGELLNKRLER